MYKVKNVKSNAYYIDENGSMAIIKNILYINGVKADDGEYPVEIEKGIITLVVIDGMVIINE